MTEPSPFVIVLAGPNGAGKSTAARALLADTFNVVTFVNADVIAQGLSGFNPESMAMEAGRIMLHRLRTLVDQRANFALESTLAGRAYAPWLRSIRVSGYTVHLIYYWVDSPDLAVARVAERVRQGGHDIPEATIRLRYQRSVHNFFQLYRNLASTWLVYDNSQMHAPRVVAAGSDTGEEMVLIEAAWRQMQREALV